MKKIIKINLLNYIVLIFFEAMFALISFDIYSKSEVLSILIYSLFSSFIMTILMTVGSEKTNKIFSYIIYFVLCFLELVLDLQVVELKLYEWSLC